VNALNTIYRWATAIVVAMVVVQIGAAGFGAFNGAEHLQHDSSLMSGKTWDDGFSFHTGFGYIVFIASIVLLVLALAARRPRRTKIFAGVLVVLVVVQILLAWAAEGHRWVGPFHAINAFLILGVSIGLAQFAFRKPDAAAPAAA
jgi:heme A synthase